MKVMRTLRLVENRLKNFNVVIEGFGNENYINHICLV